MEGVALSADGRLAISASHDNTLKVWDISNALALKGFNAGMTIKREPHTLTGHRDRVNGIALSADGRLAVSALR